MPRFLHRFSVLRRLHPGAHFESVSDHDELRERLARLVKRGRIQVIATGKHASSLSDDAWFRDPLTGAVYSYTPPDWPSVGHWQPVERPELPSFFETLCPDLYPTRAQYDALVVALDRAYAEGVIECAQHAERGELEDVFFHHPASDETYNLILVNPYQKGGSWMKVYHSHRNGSWPAALVRRPPPWR